MTPERYIEILVRHGRRVANRVVLASMPVAGRGLDDFYECYGDESELPEKEQSTTGMAHVFDPAGWFVYYTNPDYSLWPEPTHNDPT